MLDYIGIIPSYMGLHKALYGLFRDDGNMDTIVFLGFVIILPQ